MSRFRQDLYRCDNCGETLTVRNIQPKGWWRMQLALRTAYAKPEDGQPRTYDFCGQACVGAYVKKVLDESYGK